MAVSPKQFAQLLTKALKLIQVRENVTLQVLQDQIGFALGRESAGEYIRFLRKGNAPTDVADLEKLVEELAGRKGFDRPRECEQTLQYGGHPHPRQFAEKLFATTEFPASHGYPLRPFVAGPPITEPAQFFGRQRELTHIFGRWRSYPLEHIAVIGPRRSGKSSLLHYVQSITRTDQDFLRDGQNTDWLPDPSNYCWILVDFQDVRMCRRESLLRHLLMALEMPIPSPCDLDRFMDTVSQYQIERPSIILMDDVTLGLRAEELDQDFWWTMRSLVSLVSVRARKWFIGTLYDQG